MYVEVDHTPDDFLAFGTWMAVRGRGQRFAVVVWIVFGALLGSIAGSTSSSLLALTVCGLGGAVAGGAAIVLVLRHAALSAARRMGGRSELELPTLYEITPEGFSARNRAGQSLVAWWALERCGRTSQYLFILVSPAAGYIVPARAFASAADFTRFADYVDEQHERALGSVTRNPPY